MREPGLMNEVLGYSGPQPEDPFPRMARTDAEGAIPASRRCLVGIAPVQRTLPEGIQVAEQHAVKGACHGQGVIQQHAVGVPAAEGALPPLPRVVRLSQAAVQRRVLSGKGAQAVAGEVGTEDAEMMDLRAQAGFPDEGFHGRGMGAAPGRVRMEASPFVQQQALGSLEEDGACAVESLGKDGLRGGWQARKQPSDLFHPAGREIGVLEEGPFGRCGRSQRNVGQLIAQAPLQQPGLLQGMGGSLQVLEAQRLFGPCEGVSHRLAHTHAAGAVGCGSAGQLPEAARSLVEGGVHATAWIDEQARQGVGNAPGGQPFRLHLKGRGVHHHRMRQHGGHAALEAAGSELRKGVMASVGQHDVMAGLGAAIEAHDGVGPKAAAEVIDEETLSAVPEAQPED